MTLCYINGALQSCKHSAMTGCDTEAILFKAVTCGARGGIATSLVLSGVMLKLKLKVHAKRRCPLSRSWSGIYKHGTKTSQRCGRQDSIYALHALQLLAGDPAL